MFIYPVSNLLLKQKVLKCLTKLLIIFPNKQETQSQNIYIQVFSYISNAKINNWPLTCCPKGYILFIGVNLFTGT